MSSPINPPFSIKTTTAKAPIPKQKLTLWQKQHPFPGIRGREPEFIVMTAGKFLRKARKTREARMLFDHFWFENELCILFADTNSGKSVLAVQIADSVSSGTPIGNLQMTAPPLCVLYFDYELSDKQFLQRYSDADAGHHRFHKRFSRAITNPQANKMYRFNSYEEYISNEIENSLLTAKAKVLIIDNISCLQFETASATGASSLIKMLKDIKAKYNISILLLAHTPKRNPSAPITQNDLRGSKMLINFCDSAFAIGESRTQPGLRYLKQIKQRGARQTYGPNNVCLCHIEKTESFLHFTFKGQSPEALHLQQRSALETTLLKQQVTELKQQGMSIRKIAGELGLSASKVSRMLNLNLRSY